MSYDTDIFPELVVMVHLFMLVSVLIDHTRLSNSIELHCTLNIRLEIYLCVDEVETGYPIQGAPSYFQKLLEVSSNDCTYYYMKQS